MMDFFFFKQKTAYEMRISDWSSDVCSSDLMDGFDAHTGVILIAASNRPDILDPALLRPGRFDRQIVVDRPDLEGRKAILEVHAKGKPLEPNVRLDVLARRTPGYTGADLANQNGRASCRERVCPDG